MKKGSHQESPPRTKMTPSHSPSPASHLSSTRSRSLSPYSKIGTPTFSSRRQWLKHNDIMGDNDMCLDYQDDKGDRTPGVRYITETLIKKLSKQENLSLVKSLNLSLSKYGGKKFKYIENLEKCNKLEVLNLSYNLIGKIEKLDKLLKLRELNLSYNKISKIEGLEHMQNLQKLNLAGNEIDHIPLWLGKKLRSLRVLSLKDNKISSLQEVSKLKSLNDLTSLVLDGNPVVELPHYHQYTIFHLRSLESLEDQPVTSRDRQKSFDRFDLEEIERLERDLENKTKEAEELKHRQAQFLEEMKTQNEINRSLKEEAVRHKHSYKELQSDLSTKSELLKQKTMELTRSCQKQYELEQELAFYKIDAKFEPLNYYPPEYNEIYDAPGESPYIGKSRYKRNLYTTESYINDNAQPIQIQKFDLCEEELGNEQVSRKPADTLDIQLKDKENKIKAAQAQLKELYNEMATVEQNILKATEEFKQLKEAIKLKKVSETEKDVVLKQLSGKIQLLNQLRQESMNLEMQMEKQSAEITKKEMEIKDVESALDNLDHTDPRHIHVKAQKKSREQQRDIMNKQYQQLGTRLDDILTRIAKETDDIKDLEQQLTEGQIAANETLKKDLESIISGLQDYLENVKGQVTKVQDECRVLQNDKEILLQKVTKLEEEKSELEVAAMDAENMRKELAEMELLLQEHQEANKTLQQAQRDLSAYEVELETQLRAKEAESNQHKEELEKLKQLQELEHLTLQAELENERLALEEAFSKSQFSEKKEQENNELCSKVKQLEDDNNLLKQQLKDFQDEFDHMVDGLLHPEVAAARVEELKQKLETGVEEIRCLSPSDVLGKSLADLQKQFNEMLTHTQQEKEAALSRERKLQEEMAFQKEKLVEGQKDYRKACEKAADARIQSDKKQYETKIQELENEIQYLQENLKSMEEIQGFTDLQLQEADEEKERILTQLEDLENKKKLEEARSQKQFLGLDRELKELKAAVAASDKQATVELCIAKDQLKSLHGTVLRINQDRAERLQEAEHFSRQAAQAARDLTRAEAEIELLQNLLRQKEKQFQVEMEKVDTGAFGSKSQMLEIEQLNEILKRQRTEIERLWSLLDQTGSDSKGEIESLVDEITELRRTLSHQNDYISSIADPFKRRGYWYFMPSSSSSKVSSPRSQSTKDSGIGLKYTSFNPVRKECGHDKQIEKKNVTSGCWIYSPVRSGLHKVYSKNGEGNREENELDDETNTPFVPPPGSVIYTVSPDGTPVPQGTVLYASPPPVPSNGRPLEPGTVVYGPPPPGTHIVYGPPPPHFSIPLIPIGVLHCNVPEHHNLENEISRLEDIVHHVKTKRQEDKAARQQTKREMEELHQNIEDLLNERKDLQEEMAEIHRNLQKYNKQKDFMEGRGDNIITELGKDVSSKHHNQIIDEITCIESTLLKRRAELREADRLLAEAETELTNTKEKTKDTIQRYREVKTHLSWAELDAKELEHRAQETAINLMKADKQLRSLKVDGRDFKQNVPEQQEILKDPDFYSLSHKVEKLIEGLQKLQMDPEVPQGCNKDHHQGIGEPENLHTKRAELEKVKSQIAAQQQEMLVLDVHLTRKKEELHMLQVNVTKAKNDLQEAFNLRETEVAEKRNQLREIKSLLEELNFQKAELNVQISEKKTQLSLTTQEIGKEEEILHELVGQICRHKTEMKNFMDKLQHENNELQFLKVQRNQKVTELEKTQIELVQEKLELEKVQRTAQRQREEVEWQRQLLEKEKQEISQLTSEVTTLQANVEALNEEKEDLEENCESLEKKLEQAKRMLAATEDSSRIATSNLEKMELDVRKLQQEVDQLNRDKLSLHKDIANMQQHLQEKREELESLKDELTRVQDELKMTEEDLEVTSQHQSDLLSEQGNLKGNISEQMKKLHECQEQGEKKQLQLQILQSEIEERKQRLAQEEGYLHQIQTEIENEEAKLEACKAKLKDQQQLLDWELASQKSKLEQVISKVALAEERVKTLEEEEKWSATLEKTLTQTRLQLSEREEQLLKKSSELLTLQQEMDLSKGDISRLQSCFRFEKEKAEKQIIGLKEAIRTQRTQMEKALLDQKHENSCMQKEMTAIEQVAHDNHEQARRLMKELNKIQFEYLEVQKQLKNQKDLEQRHKEISEAMKLLKHEVKSELRTSLKDFNQSPPEPLEDLEIVIKKAETLESELESLKENFPFSTNECQYSFEEKLNLSKVHIMDEHWRGEAMREKLRHREDRLKAQLRSSMSRQTEALMKGKQQTEGTLHSLKRQVDALDELVTSNTADSTFLAPSLSQLEISLLEGSHLTKNQGRALSQ